MFNSYMLNYQKVYMGLSKVMCYFPNGKSTMTGESIKWILFYFLVTPNQQIQVWHTNWLVVWNIFTFSYVGNFIIPTDELHHFSEGYAQPPTSQPSYSSYGEVNLFLISCRRPHQDVSFNSLSSVDAELLKFVQLKAELRQGMPGEFWMWKIELVITSSLSDRV